MSFLLKIQMLLFDLIGVGQIEEGIIQKYFGRNKELYQKHQYSGSVINRSWLKSKEESAQKKPNVGYDIFRFNKKTVTRLIEVVLFLQKRLDKATSSLSVLNR